MSRRLRNGELLAIDDSAPVKRGAFFFMMGSRSVSNQRKGSVAIVSIRGPLEHHACWYSDSYEGIVERVRCAMDGEIEPRDDEYDYHHEPDGDEEQATPPSCVILLIDSPGGVVAGLNETVLTLRAMSKERGIPIIAYVNELAASAAYALCCACERVVCPPSAIIGSVGVISTICSQAEADKKMGIDVRLLTSGKRKADGHAHAPITDGALVAEKRRLDQSALAFFRLVEEARGMSVKKIRGLEAGIFQGDDAVKIGLADEVMSFSDALLALDESESPTSSPEAGGNETDRRAVERPGAHVPKSAKKALDKVRRIGPRSVAQPGKAQSGTPPSGDREMFKLKALIKKTEAAISAEKDTEKLAELYMSLSAYKKTEKHVEHTKSESDDDDDEDDDDDDDKKKDEEDDEDDEKKSSKKSAAPEKDEKKSAKKDEESAAKKDEEDDEEEESASAEDEEEKATSAILSLVKAAVPAKKGKAMVGSLAALLDKAGKYDALADRVAKIEGSGRKSQRETVIANALSKKLITKPQAAELATKKLEFVQNYVAMQRTPLVHTDEGDLAAPDPERASARSEGLSAEMIKSVDDAVRGSGLTGDSAAALRQKMIGAAKKTLADMNGAAAGRY